MSRRNSFKAKSDLRAPRRDRQQRITPVQKQRDWGSIPAKYVYGVALLDRAEECILNDLRNHEGDIYQLDIEGIDPEVALLLCQAACDRHVAAGGKLPAAIVLNQEEVNS